MRRSSYLCAATLLIILSLFFLAAESGAQTHTITFKNSCAQTIWVGQHGTLPDSSLLAGGWEMAAGSSVAKAIPVGFSGNWWPRTGCNFNSSGVCATAGDCCDSGGCEISDDGTYGLACLKTGQPPAPLFEVTFDAESGNGPIDYVDISLVTGFSVPLQMSPDSGTYNTSPDPGMNAEFWCRTKGFATNPTCPPALWDTDKDICYGPCTYYTSVLAAGNRTPDNQANICCDNSNLTPPSTATCANDGFAGGYGCSPYAAEGVDNERCYAKDPGKRGYWGDITDAAWPAAGSVSLQYMANVNNGAPGIYAWQFDDLNSTYNCRKTGGQVNYTVTFCPGAATYTLTVSKSGTGTGTVTSSPSGVNCGATCSDTFSPGAVVTLTAMPGTDSAFSGWSGGGCSGTSACTVTLTKNVTVTANFIATPDCTYTISPGAKTFSSKAGTANVTVAGKGAKGVTCDVATAVSGDPSWIGAISPVWKNNKGTAKITVDANTTSSARNGAVTIADKTFTVTQQGAACAITALTPSSESVPASGGSYSVGVTLSPQDCAWTAAANKSWITVTSGSGTGDGTVAYTVPANTTGKSLNGAITVTLTKGGKKKTHTVKQAGK